MGGRLVGRPPSSTSASAAVIIATTHPYLSAEGTLTLVEGGTFPVRAFATVR